MPDPTQICGDEFEENVCERSAGHAGDHQQTVEAGILSWSDPLPYPVDFEDEEEDTWDD